MTDEQQNTGNPISSALPVSPRGPVVSIPPSAGSSLPNKTPQAPLSVSSLPPRSTPPPVTSSDRPVVPPVSPQSLRASSGVSAPASTVPPAGRFPTPIPAPSPSIRNQSSPLYVRPAQNTTEPSKPTVTGQLGDIKKPPIAPEFLTSIRTMADDVAKLKLGQQPSGVEMVRPISTLPSVALPTKETVPSVANQPTADTLQRAKQSGETVSPEQSKKSPLDMPVSTKPITPPVIGRSPIIPPAPQKPLHTSPIKDFTVYLLREWGLNMRKIMFIGVPIVVGCGLLIYALIFREPNGAAVIQTPPPTTRPTQSVTPTEVSRGNLATFFGAPTGSVYSTTSVGSVADFYRDLAVIAVDPGKFNSIVVTPGDSASKSFNMFEIFERLGIVYPADLKQYVGQEHAELLFGQTEIIDDMGASGEVTTPKRLTFIIEVTDAASVSLIMSEWESAAIGALANIFVFDQQEISSVGAFLSDTRFDTIIRYVNFPYADKSIDYAIVSSSNRKIYLVMANSREAMYAAIQIIK